MKNLKELIAEIPSLPNEKHQLLWAAQILLIEGPSYERECSCPSGWDQNTYNDMAGLGRDNSIILSREMIRHCHKVLNHTSVEA